MAAKGMCFSCYRIYREARNPQLAFKRRSQRASYARRMALSTKVRKREELLEGIRTAVLERLRPMLSQTQYAHASNALKTALMQEAVKNARTDKRQLKVLARMEAIEAEGGVPIVVNSADWIRKNLIPDDCLAQIENSGALDAQYDPEDLDLEGEEDEA